MKKLKISICLQFLPVLQFKVQIYARLQLATEDDATDSPVRFYCTLQYVCT